MSSLLTKPIVQHHRSRVSPIQLRGFPLAVISNVSLISCLSPWAKAPPRCVGHWTPSLPGLRLLACSTFYYTCLPFTALQYKTMNTEGTPWRHNNNYSVHSMVYSIPTRQGLLIEAGLKNLQAAIQLRNGSAVCDRSIAVFNITTHGKRSPVARNVLRRVNEQNQYYLRCGTF